MPEVSLEIIAKRLERLLGEIADVRDEQLVTNAMLRAMEASQQAMFVQLTTMTRQFSRLNDRVAKLEDAS